MAAELPVGIATRTCRLDTATSEHFFKALAQAGVEIVQNQVNSAPPRVPVTPHPANEGDKVDRGAPGRSLCGSAG